MVQVTIHKEYWEEMLLIWDFRADLEANNSNSSSSSSNNKLIKFRMMNYLKAYLLSLIIRTCLIG